MKRLLLSAVIGLAACCALAGCFPSVTDPPQELGSTQPFIAAEECGRIFVIEPAAAGLYAKAESRVVYLPNPWVDTDESTCKDEPQFRVTDLCDRTYTVAWRSPPHAIVTPHELHGGARCVALE